MQIRVTAERIYAHLPAEERARLEAYARGVNLFISQHQDTLPPEFRLLHYNPQPWTGVDSVSVGLMMAEMLDMHWYTKLGREHVAARLQNPKLEAELYPVGSWRDHPPTGVRVDLSQPDAVPPLRQTTMTTMRTTTAARRGLPIRQMSRVRCARCLACQPARAARRGRTIG